MCFLTFLAFNLYRNSIVKTATETQSSNMKTMYGAVSFIQRYVS